MLEQLRDRIQLKHFSPHTESAYAQWVKRYIYFYGKRHPLELGKEDVQGASDVAGGGCSLAAFTQRVAHRLGDAQRNPSICE